MRNKLAVLGIVLALTAAGCRQPATRGPDGLALAAPDVPTQRALRERAVRLLLRAVETGEPVLQAHAIEALVEVDPDAGRDAFTTALQHENPLVRYAGAVALGEVRARGAAESVLPLLRDEDPRVRLGAAFAAYRLGYQQAAQVLVDGLRGAADERVRAEAAWLLGKLGEPRARTQLEYAIQREDSSYVAVHLDSALALLGDEDALERVIEYSLKSDAVSITLALQTLVEVRAPAARDALEYVLFNASAYRTVRLLAARALGGMGVDIGFSLALDSLDYAARDERMSLDERAAATVQVRVAAAMALGAIGDPRALPALQAVAESETEPRIQVAAAWAIARIVDARQRAVWERANVR